MSEPSLAVQIAITATLKAASIGAQVFDHVPPNQPAPYVRTGDDQVVPTPADCMDGAVEVRSTLHVFSTRRGRREAKTIAGAIVIALEGAALDLGPSWALVDIHHTGTRVIDEPDDTAHAVVTFTTLADPA